CKKRDCEKQKDRLSASKRSARHFRHQRIEQISKNRGNRHRDQNGLKKADDIGRSPDEGSNDEDENNDETGSQRRPHHLALPGRGVFLHVTTLNAEHPTLNGRRTRWSLFDVDVDALTKSDCSLLVNPSRWSFWWFESCPRVFCSWDRAPALFAKLPKLPWRDSISNKCRRCVRIQPGPRALRPLQREAGRSKLDQTDL